VHNETSTNGPWLVAGRWCPEREILKRESEWLSDANRRRYCPSFTRFPRDSCDRARVNGALSADRVRIIVIVIVIVVSVDKLGLCIRSSPINYSFGNAAHARAGANIKLRRYR